MGALCLFTALVSLIAFPLMIQHQYHKWMIEYHTRAGNDVKARYYRELMEYSDPCCGQGKPVLVNGKIYYQLNNNRNIMFDRKGTAFHFDGRKFERPPPPKPMYV